MPKAISDNEHVFQTAAWMWLAYLLAMASIDHLIYVGELVDPVLWYYLVNGLPVLIFLGVTYSGWLRKQGDVPALVMILLITISPILINYATNIHLPPAPLSNLEGMVLRQLPVLFIGLVLVAWNYNLATVILYSLVTTILEIGIVFGFALLSGGRLTALFFIVIIRAVCLIVVGIFPSTS